MIRTVLGNSQWDRIKGSLPGKSGDCGVTARDNRLFVEAVLWIARTGSPWRDLPEGFGHWHRVYVRYNRWCKKGTWLKLLAAVSHDPDLEYLMADGSIVRVHQHGTAKKTAKTMRPWASRGAG
jgi:transposase